MPRTALLAIPLLLTGTDVALAQIAPEQAFIDFQTALAIDSRCHFLRYLEYGYIDQVELALLRPLEFNAAYESGRITVDQFHADFNKLADMGKARAAAITCADEAAAAPFILGLREQAATLIYSDLMIAFDTNELAPELQQAGQAYEAMIAPMYGEHWQGFVDFAGQHAQAKIDRVRQQDADAAPFAALFNPNTPLGEEPDPNTIQSSGIYFDEMVRETARKLDTILFDLTAADAGFRVRREGDLDNQAGVITLADASGARIYDLIDSPDRYETVERDAEVHFVIAVNQQKEMRLLTWGAEAQRALFNGSVTILVNPNSLPEDQSTNYTYMRSEEWWNDALVYHAPRLDEPCLGAPCFGLPAEVVETILASSPGQAFRFFISSNPDPALPERNSMQVHTGFTFALDRWVAFKAAEAQ